MIWLRLLLAGMLLWPSLAWAQADPADSSPFERIDDFPPDDFVAALGWAGGGAGREGEFCSLLPSGELVAHTERGLQPCTLRLDDILEVDTSAFKDQGWDLRAEPVTSARGPDGVAIDEQLDELGNRVLQIPRDAPLGAYTLTVHQGDQTATGPFEVVARTDRPLIRAVPRQPWTGNCCPEGGTALGTTVDVRLAGYEPRQSVKLMLFNGGGNYLYRTTLATIQTDDLGRAVYPLQTTPDDPQGAYYVQTLPAAEGVIFPRLQGAPLCLTVPPDAVPCRASFNPEQPALLFQRLVSQSNQVWARASARAGEPLSSLSCVFGGDYLVDVTDWVAELRQQGHYATIYETAPPTIQDVTETGDPFDGGRSARVGVVEHLSVLVFDSDDELVNDLSGDVPHVYTIDQSSSIRNARSAPAPCRSGWLITADDT